MSAQLSGKRVAALVANGFEQVELVEPRRALEAAGATVHVVSPESQAVRGWNHTDWGNEVRVDRPLDQASPEDYDGLLLPGGVMNPDRLRANPPSRREELLHELGGAGKRRLAQRKVIYWHRDLPPISADHIGEHVVEATSMRVKGPLARGDELWDRCHDDLMGSSRRSTRAEGGAAWRSLWPRTPGIN